MPTEITMPKLSDTMEEGTVLQWRIKEGDTVRPGDVIAEVETDKAAMEMEAFENGTVSELRVKQGETVPVGTVLAILNGAGQQKEGRAEASQKPQEAAPQHREEKVAAEEKPARRGGAAKEEEQVSEEEQAAARQEQSPAAAEKTLEEKEVSTEAGEQAPSKEAQKPRPDGPAMPRLEAVSPAARKLAKEKGIDLARVRGTGPGGRIVLADVEKMQGQGQQPSPPVGTMDASAEGARMGRKSTTVRRVVAGKMVESWQQVPHFFVTVAVDMTDVIRFRKDLGVSINDFVITATARCLREHPWVNSLWQEGEGVEQSTINISLAVATERGLYNPVLHDCGSMPLKEVGRRSTELAKKAHAGKLTREDMEGGTFTISNMGMLGVESFTAIITPPQAAVLAVGTARGEVIVDEKGEPGIAPIMRLTLSADHRILDGADAAAFLTDLKSYLEAPVTLITH
jgi:pyruvate dehydrogenase E2 component (dihydrolipoamide acetyltransferase)